MKKKKPSNDPAYGVFTSPLGDTLKDKPKASPARPSKALQLKSRSQIPIIIDDVIRLFVEEGHSARSIARALGVSVQLVSRAIVEHDLASLRKEYSTPSRCQVVHLRVLMNATIERLVERRRASTAGVSQLPSADEWKTLDLAARLIERLEMRSPNFLSSFVKFANGIATAARREKDSTFCAELADLITDYGERLRSERSEIKADE